MSAAPCPHCPANRYAEPMDYLDQMLEDDRQKMRESCTLVAKADKPCLKLAQAHTRQAPAAAQTGVAVSCDLLDAARAARELAALLEHTISRIRAGDTDVAEAIEEAAAITDALGNDMAVVHECGAAIFPSSMPFVGGKQATAQGGEA